MKLILELNNTTTQKFSKKKFLSVFERTLELANLKCLESKILEVSVALIEEEEIEKLNTQYRKRNKPTDVLSFCEFESMQQLCKTKEEQIFLGELIVCPEYIAQNADDGETAGHAMDYIVSHGILHLLGFDHGKRMFSLQQSVANQLEKK
ncbi:MAG: hypothetical protein ACD_9C00140G0001 [uncultured bacterium]|nr:MAG: hypothetical protein ACD_9C00140G0001 [uncultured bacterium]